VDCCGDPEAAAEGSYLSQFYYDDLKTKKEDRVAVSPLGEGGSEWERGRILAESQNLARW